MTTGKLKSFESFGPFETFGSFDRVDNWLSGVPPSLATASFGGQASLYRPVHRSAEGAKVDRPRLCLTKRLHGVSRFKEQKTTEYPANGSSISPVHTRGGGTALSRSARYREVSAARLLLKDKYGQASRLISTSQLNALLRFHIWPINLVVYQEPLGVLRLGRSHLVEGFTLRCIQRFSLPDVATRRCRWRDNRYTRGPSNPVLSY